VNDQSYDYVPAIPKPWDLERLPNDRMHHWRNSDLVSGEIEADLVAFQPIHVGTGDLAIPANLGVADCPYSMVKAFFRTGPQDGRAIPATSLKGAVRVVVEAITASCINKAKTRGRDSLRVERGEIECQYDASKGRTRLCIACRMFGAMGYQGQVGFEDAPQIKGDNAVVTIPPQWPPKPRASRRKFYYHSSSKGGQWPLEVCPVDSRFMLHVHFVNLTDAEVGLLLVALGEPAGEGRRLCLKMGGGKNAGLGSLRVEGLQLRVWKDPKAAYLAYKSEADLSEVSKDTYVAVVQAQGSPLNLAALRQLQNILACPATGGA
jgi:CRISPR/Cas system CSM-associated protein Csm3 (group 7 of RAMP superfamily)